MEKVLIVSPVFNEAKVLPEFVAAFSKLRHELAAQTDLRLLLVNDGSTDSTMDYLKKVSAEYGDSIYYISFTANFGYQAALIAGLSQAGDWPDALLTMDCDLEHPMETVPQLITAWKRDRSVVVNTERKEAKELGLRKRLFSKLFYRVTGMLTGLDLGEGQADFKLWDARVLRALSMHLPNVGSLRVFAAWMPGRKSIVPYRQHVRSERVTRFTFKKNWDLAMISIVRFSTFPLRAIGLMGALGVLLSCFYVVYVAYQASTGVEYRGWASTILTIVFMGCLQLISVGILATYMRRLVFAKDLPLYIIDESKRPPSA